MSYYSTKLTHPLLKMWGSIFLAFCLSILPLPAAVAEFSPLWILAVLAYWMIYASFSIPLWFVFIVGLLFDLLTHTLLGLHAFLLVFVAYFFHKYPMRIRQFSHWQKILTISLFSAIYLFIQYWIRALTENFHVSIFYGMPVLTTAILWIWLSVLGDEGTSRYGLLD